MTIGDKIKHYRKLRNMTQSELARKVGYKTRSTLSTIENNEGTPTQKNLIKIAAALEVSPAELLEGTSAPISSNRAALIQMAWELSDGDADLMLQIMQSFLRRGQKDTLPGHQSGKE